MKIFETKHIYNYEWSVVSAANWRKYPNEGSPHVQAVDILNQHVDPETGILTTERLFTVTQNVPTIILKVYIFKHIEYHPCNTKPAVDTWLGHHTLCPRSFHRRPTNENADHAKRELDHGQLTECAGDYSI